MCTLPEGNRQETAGGVCRYGECGSRRRGTFGDGYVSEDGYIGDMQAIKDGIAT